MNIPNPLHDPIPPIPHGIEQRSHRSKILLFPIHLIPPFEPISSDIPAEPAIRRPHGSQVLRQQMTVMLHTDIQPQRIIIVLLHRLCPHETHLLRIIHHREIRRPAAAKHLLIIHLCLATNKNAHVFRPSVYQSILRIRHTYTHVSSKLSLTKKKANLSADFPYYVLISFYTSSNTDTIYCQYTSDTL